jgi:adenylate cyclase
MTLEPGATEPEAPEPGPAPPGPDRRLSADDLAIRLNVDRERVDRLARIGVLERDATGRFDAGDVHRIRLLNAFEEAGVPTDALTAASRAGAISLRYYDQLHPPPSDPSVRTYRAFAAGLGPGAEHLTRLFAAFGIAEPEADAHLSVEDEALIAESLDIVVATGAPDLALRAIRLLGEGARRATDGGLGVYGEAVERIGEDVGGLPVDSQFDRLLRPWARFARHTPALATWLTSRHMTRAIDEYSVVQTERILEDAGFVATRPSVPPAVAFADLTGFTRLTEELGDEAAAAIALRLGDAAAEAIRPHGGRVVKLLGDGVLIRFDDLLSAIRGSLDLLEALPPAGLPAGHIGIAAGPLIQRDGDVFGRTVNLAARIADTAPGGRVYVPAEAVEELGPADGLRATAVEPAELQGIGRVALAWITRAGDRPASAGIDVAAGGRSG